MTRKNTPTPDMLKVFETVPDLYLILSPDLYILTASDAYLNTAHIIRQEIVGKHLLEVFPNHEDAHHAETINNIQASLQEVLSTQKPLQMEVQRYDIPQPSAPGDGFEKKYWKPVNTPVLDEEGEIRYIIHKIIDATEHQSDQQQIYDLSDREQAALAEAEWERNKLREILMQAPVAIGIYEGKNHIIELINPLMSEVIGRKADEVLGKALFEALPELEGQGYETVLSEVYSSGKPIEFKESPATLNRNGKLVQGFYHTVYQPIKNAKGEVSGIINIVTDISEQVENRKALEKLNQKLEEQVALRTEELTLAKGQIEAERNTLQAMFDQAPVAMGLFKGEQLEVIFANQLICDMWGYAPEQVLNKPLLEGVPELKGQNFDNILREVLATGVPYIGKEVAAKLPRNGNLETYYFNFVYQPLYDKNGEILGVVDVVIDVTELFLSRKQAEDREKTLQLLNEKLSTTNQELESVNYELAEAQVLLEQLNSELEERVLLRTKDLALVQKEAEIQRNTLHDLFMKAPAPIVILDGEELVYQLVNPAYQQIFPGRELLDKALLEALPELEGTAIPDILNKVYKSGEIFVAKEMPLMLARNQEDPLEELYFTFTYQARRNQHGTIDGVLVFAHEVTDQVNARKKVEESELRIRTLMESIPQMAWTNLPNGEVNFYNQRWQEYTGLSLEQIYGWGWQPLLHPDDLDDMLVTYLKSLETGSEFVHENRLKRQDGSYRWHLNRSVPLRDEKGKISLWVGTSTDIHEQKMLEQRLMESEQYFRMMADNVPVMIWITDPNGQCTYLNKQWYDYTGQTQETALGLGWLHAVHPDDSQTAADVFLNANDKQIPFNLTYRLKRKDNKIRWYVDIGLPKFSAEGEFEGFVGVVIDIHERKLAEEAVQKLSHELAAINEELRAANEEIQANNEELSSSNQQLSFINADMDNFIYTASHDLRAPISNIEGLMAALLRNLTEEDQKAPMINKLSGMITKSIDRFKKTLEDLTQITKVQREGSGEDITQIDLTQVISEVQLDLATQIEQADAQFEITLNHCTLIHFSAKNARSIVYNLLSNAIKYRSPLRQTFVRVSCYPEGDYLVLSVEDNGLGMNLSDESKIFAMFKRLHDHVEGTGVGLYIVKKIIENAGGKIEVQSTLDQGTTFKVYFKQST